MKLLSFNIARLCQGSFYTPSSLYSSVKSVVLESKFFSPLLKRLFFTIVGDKSSIFSLPSVSGLFLSCRPLAVSRKVPFFVIYSVYGVLFSWTLPHVINEVFVGEPSFTNSNTSSPVLMVAGRVGACASVDHGGPSVSCKRIHGQTIAQQKTDYNTPDTNYGV